jgi:erythromycin esterase
MGSYLAKRGDYVPIGFVFDHGTYNASPTGVNLEDARQPVDVGPAPPTDIASAFARTGAELLLVDLREASGNVAEYLGRPQLSRETGWNISDAQTMAGPRRLAKRFAAVIYVARSTPSRLLDGGGRPGLTPAAK